MNAVNRTGVTAECLRSAEGIETKKLAVVNKRDANRFKGDGEANWQLEV